jgi:hypothetical protein
MKNFTKFFTSLLLLTATHHAIAQNIFHEQRVQVVGTFNNFTTNPYGNDYRTTTYRKVSTTTGTQTPSSGPKDGRGQWATTINVQNTGGDVAPINMTGGGSGFSFISGDANNRFNNRWVFNSAMQGTIDGVSTSIYQGTTDMGLNMSTIGHYTFVMNDFGYTASPDTRYYVGYTASDPVTVSRSSQTVNGDGTTTVNITSSSALSPQEKIYVRSVNGASADFSGSTATSIVQATGSGTAYNATITAPPSSNTVNYYVFTSTTSLSALIAANELDRSLSTLRYDDNAGANYSNVVTLPVSFISFDAKLNNSGMVDLTWLTASESNNSHFIVSKSTDGLNFSQVSKINGSGTSDKQNHYQAVDKKPTKGNNYYQLRQYDFDGKETVLATKDVNFSLKNTNEVSVYPNPAQDVLNIKFDATSYYNAKLVDFNGKVLVSKAIDINQVESTFNISDLPAGNYIILLEGKKGLISKGLIKN